MNKADIDRLVRDWLQVELEKDAVARSDLSFAADWVREGENVNSLAARMLRSEAESSLFEWREVAETHDWQQAAPYVNAFLSTRGIDLDRNSDIYRYFCQAVSLASQELHGIRVERSMGRWDKMPYAASDAAVAPSGYGTATRPNEEPIAKPAGISIKDAAQAFLDERRRMDKLKPKRLMDIEAALTLLGRFLGEARAVNNVTKADIGRLRTLLTKLPPNYTKILPGLPIDEVAQLARDRGLEVRSAGTINQKYLVIIDRFFQWCVTGGHMDENPASGVRVKLMSSRTEDPRGTFSADELKVIFGAPLFTGCRSPSRIYEAGSAKVRDHRYWLPLLSLFTGARLGELCQLLVRDVRKVDGIWCIDISPGEGKSVKTKAGRRTVPLHPELLRLGFADFVETCRSGRAHRLFPEIEFGRGGYLSDNTSKWFARFLRKTLGDDLVKKRKLVFHSFRHTVKDALRVAGVDERIQDALLGHESDHVSSVYGEGYKPPRLFEEISKVTYQGLDLTPLYPPTTI
jgi:integrase